MLKLKLKIDTIHNLYLNYPSYEEGAGRGCKNLNYVRCLFLFISIFSFKITTAQHQYYKTVSAGITSQFSDTTKRVTFKTPDSTNIYAPIFNYVLKFYPTILLKNIKVYFKPSQTITSVKPTFFSIFKAPQNRTYKLYFSTITNTTLDSVLLKNLSYNAKVGLISRQISHVQDLSTTHFFGFIAWYFVHTSRKAINKAEYDAELKTLEAGLGYQLLGLANETNFKLKIEKWKSPVGYSAYVRKNGGRYMLPETISNFVSDMPIYVSNQYK